MIASDMRLDFRPCAFVRQLIASPQTHSAQGGFVLRSDQPLAIIDRSKAHPQEVYDALKIPCATDAGGDPVSLSACEPGAGTTRRRWRAVLNPVLYARWLAADARDSLYSGERCRAGRDLLLRLERQVPPVTHPRHEIRRRLPAHGNQRRQLVWHDDGALQGVWRILHYGLSAAAAPLGAQARRHS